MSPEEAMYYRFMLIAGIRDRLDEAVNHALETQDPLTGPFLDLAFCMSNQNSILSVLQEFITNAEHSADEQAVCRMILDVLRRRYLNEKMSRLEIARIIHSIYTYSAQHYYFDLCEGLEYPYYIFDWLSEYMISQETFNDCFDAFLLRGECPKPNKVQSEPQTFTKVSPHSRAYYKHLAITIFFAILSFVTIFLTVILTGEKRTSEFTQNDWIIFISFLIVESAIIVLEFYFANRCGRLRYGTIPPRKSKKH